MGELQNLRGQKRERERDRKGVDKRLRDKERMDWRGKTDLE